MGICEGELRKCRNKVNTEVKGTGFALYDTEMILKRCFVLFAYIK